MTTMVDRRGVRPFLAVWLPSLVVIIASGSCLFTLSWWISRSPGAGASLGLTVGASSVVSLLTVTVLSGVVDRADRRRTMLCLLGLLAVAAGVLTTVVTRSPVGLAVLAAAACYTLISTTETLYLAANETVSADLAPDDWPAARVALLSQIHSQVERIVAPTLAGALIAAGAVGAVPVAAVAVIAAMALAVLAGRRHLDAVTVSTGSAAREHTEPTSGALRQLLRDAGTAVRLIRRHHDLVFLVQLGILTNLVVFPFYAVLPAFLGEYVTDGKAVASFYGHAATAYGAGMLAGTLVLARMRRDLTGRNSLVAATGCLAVIGVVLIMACATHSPWAVVAAMAVNGALFAALVAIGGAIWLRRTPAEIRVRVFSLRRLTVFSSIPLGTVLLGFGGAAMGYRTFTTLLTVFVLTALVLAWLRFRASDRLAIPVPKELS